MLASGGGPCKVLGMESKVERYTFRVLFRKETHELGGRVVEDAEGRYKLQMWAHSPQHANILLEVAPVDSRDDLWPLLRTVAAHRGMQVLEYRPDPMKGRDWEPVPGG